MHQVFEALARNARQFPAEAAFEDDTQSVTWATLAGRVADLAARLGATDGPVAIALAGGVDYVVADLAVSLAGRRQVPLPFFFSREQNAHILMDAGVTTVITSTPDLFAPLPHLHLVDPAAAAQDTSLPAYRGGSERVIYTSGSSGRPKGVIIGDGQLSASLTALSAVIAAGPGDIHLSVLPLAQLLEQICGIFLPIMARARTVFRFEATKALLGAPVAPLAQAFEAVRPTTSVLAPSVLARWTAHLRETGHCAPDSLRFVAVGGASSAPDLIRAANRAGIPAYEGYGLSECCAVVAMNRPGDNKPGTVGQVLDGLDVRIDAGEIVVSGPTVMQGYLNADPAPRVWRTGDLGHFDGDRLVVDGRKDALLVTGAGRNISPEWVEQRVNADPRVVASALGLRADDTLVLIVAAAAPVPVSDIAALLGDLPEYARPSEAIVTRPDEPGLLFPAGTPNRETVAKIVNARAAQPLARSKEDIAS